MGFHVASGDGLGFDQVARAYGSGILVMSRAAVPI